MKTLAILAPVVALMAAAPAFAMDIDTGRLTGVNSQTATVSLDNGHQYTLKNPSQLIGVMPGEQVIVTYQGKTAVGFTDDPAQFETASSPAP
jgi:hypothetical protein